jgi:methionine-S-sulfoxide reductase
MLTFTRTRIASLAALAAAGVALAATQSPATRAAPAQQQGLEVATFASGCFWSSEYDFDKVDGVRETTSGFMGGKTKAPTYEQVSAGGTGHAEAVQLKYDPKVVTYQQLLDYYWRHVDLVDGGGQFCDRGSQYRPVVFVATPEQRKSAEASKADLGKSGRFAQPIAVEIADAGEFTPAEAHHQNFHNTNAQYYKRYRVGCGRDARLKQLWGSEATH